MDNAIFNKTGQLLTVECYSTNIKTFLTFILVQSKKQIKIEKQPKLKHTEDLN